MAVLATSLFSLLVGATVASYTPQYTRIYSLRSSAGISLTSTLFLALAAQTQLVQMYYLFTIHPDTRHGGVVPKPIKLQDWLNLAQIIAQWTCAVILFLLAFMYSPISSSEPPATAADNRTSISRKTALTLLFSHALLSLISIFIVGKSLRQLGNIVFLIVMSANENIAIPLSTLATLAAFSIQVYAQKPISAPSALSRPSIILQAIAFLTLTALWPFRFPSPQTLWPRQSSLSLSLEWFCVMGCACINHGIMAIGQFVVLYSTAAGSNDGSVQSLGERQSLLST
ncbi:hypothetical protein MBLNU13_g08134t1 [Cladosporium sp. NU13]